MKLFGGSSSNRKEDIQKIKEIRDIVDNSGRPMQPSQIPQGPPRQPVQGPPRGPPQIRPPAQIRPPPQPEPQPSTPSLFIKIERYQEIAKQIQSLKSLALTLRDAMEALSEMEKELKNGMQMAQGALDKFNYTLLQLDGSLIRSQGVAMSPTEDTKELEEYVRGVYKQVQRMKGDMRTISSVED
ncbi:MAG: hypothetical protein JW716_02390 [Candidatus Aenigmarchaeota archaeon]|nr:hypothetical protein [Candidatus Aenigmarchaeota archaeon]